MTFINTKILKSDNERYSLDFDLYLEPYWTADRDRDIYLWGGASGSQSS